MRQGQRDRSLVGSATYLVDAIRPEAGAGTPEGAGWFSDNSFLRREFPDIVYLSCLTSEAIRYFKKNRIAIDFLHIDADHSYGAVLADFSNYRSLLNPGAFVTFHDASLESVRSALRVIEGNYREYGVLELPDIGNGLAVLRRKEHPMARSPSPLQMPNAETACRPRDSSSEIWHYLLDPVLQSRYALAAHFLRDIDTILEIGGYKTPITDFLTHGPKKVVVIDPYLEPREETALHGRPCEVRHLPVDLDEFDYVAFSKDRFALIFLGMDLYSPEKSTAANVDTYARFVDLLSRAERAVLEYPKYWDRSKRLFDMLLSVLHPRIVYECVMDLSSNPVPGLGNEADRLVRRLVVLDQMEAIASQAEIRRKIAHSLYGSGAEAILAGGRESFEEIPGALRLQDTQLAYDEASCEINDAGELLIRTSNKPWSYAIFVPFQHSLSDLRAALIHVRARVDEGGLAVGALSNDGSAVVGERFLTAKAGELQELDVFVPDLSAVKGFLCRNGQQPTVSAGVLLELQLLTRPVEGTEDR